MPSEEHAPHWAARFRALPFPSTAEKMLVYAKAQVEFIRDVVPGREPGGRLIVAEITRDRMTIRPVGEL